MGFGILRAARPGDASSPLHPTLSRAGSVSPSLRLERSDGDDVEAHRLTGCTVYALSRGHLEIADATAALEGTLWVTDARVVVAGRPRRLQPGGRTIVGHLYAPWISKVLWRPGAVRGPCPALRLAVEAEGRDGAVAEQLLEVRLEDDADAAGLADAIVRRVARWHLRATVGFDHDVRERLTGLVLTGLPPAPPISGLFAACVLPLHHGVGVLTTPEAFAARAGEPAVH